MTEKKKKQFGVWMDTHQATIVGKAADSDDFTVLGIAGDAGAQGNGSEKTRHQDKSPHLQNRFFKEILFYMQNADEVHLTGTGTSQEQLIHYMADTPQFKDTLTKESTSNKMSDENLAAYISEKFN